MIETSPGNYQAWVALPGRVTCGKIRVQLDKECYLRFGANAAKTAFGTGTGESADYIAVPVGAITIYAAAYPPFSIMHFSSAET
ncbi:MAG: hypothetical protein JO110_29035 [Acetobacteraceae bacterium]|nr:hypothetical protein [Acetobacteraceae bacterium]